MLNVTDYDEVTRESQRILSELQSTTKGEWFSNKSKIKRYIELQRILLNDGKLSDVLPNKSSFASYIFATLTQYEVPVYRTGEYYSWFDETEKDMRQSRVEQNSTEISSGHETVNQQYKKKTDEPIKFVINDEYTDAIKIIVDIAEKIIAICAAEKEKYSSNLDMRQEIQNVIGDLEQFKLKYGDYLGKFNNIREYLDKRNMWGDFEQLLMKFLIEVGETKANLAARVGYSSKWSSIKVERNPEFDELSAFLRSCPSCHTNIAFLINETIAKYKAGKELGVQLPLHGY